MIKSNKHIEIVRSSVKDLSSMRQVSCNAALAVLARHFRTVRISIVDNPSDLELLALRDPDLIFLGMEFIPTNPALGISNPDKVWVSDFLDAQGIAYTGSSQSAHELERNKPLAKQYVLDVGLKTSAFHVIKQGQSFSRHDISLQFPLFVKPTRRGGGLGIGSESVVQNFAQLCARVDVVATKFQTDTLIEEYLPGREFSVAILKDEDSTEFQVMPIELIAPRDSHGARLLGSHVKSSNSKQVLQVSDDIIRSKVKKLALQAFYVLRARDYGRIDIRLDSAGVPHFLEANLIPSLISGYGSFPKAWMANIGLDYEPMTLRIAQLGLAHTNHDRDIILDTIITNDVTFLSPEVIF